MDYKVRISSVIIKILWSVLGGVLNLIFRQLSLILKKVRLVFIFLLTLFFLGCGANYFSEFSDTETDEAKLFAAKKAMNERNYGAAISFLESLSAEAIAERDNTVLYASAFSGRCGLEFITLLNRLGEAGATSILGTLMTSFPGSEISQIADCLQAESILKSVGDESLRTIDENLLATLNSMAKIGVSLSATLDKDADSVVDPGNVHCTEMTDDQVREIVTGLSITLLSLGAIGSSYIDVAEITSFCTLTPDLTSACGKTDISGVTDDEVDVVRLIIGSTDFGVGSCGDTFASVACVTSCP